jgi:hypothetical protein
LPRLPSAARASLPTTNNSLPRESPKPPYCCHDFAVPWPPPAHRPAYQLPAPCPHCHSCRFLGVFSRNSRVAASPNLPRRASHPADPSRCPTEKDSVDVTSRNRTSASPSGHWTSPILTHHSTVIGIPILQIFLARRITFSIII